MNERLKQLKDYSFFRIIKFGFNFIRTKLFYRPALFIFFPFDIRNKKYIKLGEGMTCGTGCRFEAYPIHHNLKPVLILGKNIQINDYVHITASSQVKIDDHVLMASRIYISDVQHGCYSGDGVHSRPDTIAKNRKLTCLPVHIEENVWIGEGVCILPGVTIGRNSVIGANAVVTKSMPANAIVAGNPAKVIKTYDAQTEKWVKTVK